MDKCNIYLNKNSVPGDKSALVPGGVRLGTPAMTTRGLKEPDFDYVASIVDKGIILAKNIKNKLGEGKKIADF